MSMFPEAAEMDFMSLLFMMVVYGYILMKASQIISGGSEMLLLIYGPGIVGGLLIPILGAIPDCAIILISGMGNGTKSEIQNELSVGVGTLVGSTVMLLTIPWCAGVFLGRRDLDESKGCAKQAVGKSKVTSFSLTKNVVDVLAEIPETAKIMMLSCLSYLIIQIPAFMYKNTSDQGVSEEAPFALLGLFVTFAAFCGYCYIQYSSSASSELTKRLHKNFKKAQWKASFSQKSTQKEHLEKLFKKHDKDNSNTIDLEEFVNLMNELEFDGDRNEMIALFNEVDQGHGELNEGKGDRKINFHEFQKAIEYWVVHGKTELEKAKKEIEPTKVCDIPKLNNDQENPLLGTHKDHHYENHEEDEEEEEEDNFWHLTDNQLKLQAYFLLLIGTFICTVFSDPMVDVISHIGSKMNVSPFYISFVVTPLASNASEVIAGLIFARKKTTESISLTLSTLHGAATMNSTLSLCLFMSLIYFRQLSWSFSAEVITVMFVIISVGLNSLRKTIYLWQAVMIGSLYPFSILMVYIMESQFGLD
jgi:Ca2+/Na+ antiporter